MQKAGTRGTESNSARNLATGSPQGRSAIVDRNYHHLAPGSGSPGARQVPAFGPPGAPFRCQTAS
jgi:hypothetical protein